MTGILITGTDTGVGKTHVTSLWARYLVRQGRRVGVYKPVCSGSESNGPSDPPLWPDQQRLAAALDHVVPDEWICPQRFHAPLAPPAAAAAEGKAVDPGLLISGKDVWTGQADLLLVEGVGGWLCPLTGSSTVADFAVALGYPVVIVAANRLGTINHTLLTLQAVAAAGLRCVGIVLNNVSAEPDQSAEQNAAVIRQFTQVPVVGPLPFESKPDLLIESTFASMNDWLDGAKP